MLAHERFPHAVILSGPQGSGKFTLAQMVAKAMNCLERPVSDGLPDFCGRCSNCVRIAGADALEERFTEAVEARENLRDADKRETRILVQTHPDVMIIPPDPPQMLVKVDQVRHVIHEIYYKPVEGRERVYIFSDADFMKEAANSLLKVLEEPPEFATIFLLTDNPTALLPTIRSRCMHVRLAPLAAEEIEQYLAEVRPEWKARERALVARVCGGGLGRARSFDLAGYLARASGCAGAAGPGDGHQGPQRAVPGDRHLSRRRRWKSQDRTVDSHAVCAAGGPAVPEVGDAGAGAQSRYPGGAGEDGGASGFRVDHYGQPEVGRGGERNAAEPAAVAVAGRVCHVAGAVGQFWHASVAEEGRSFTTEAQRAQRKQNLWPRISARVKGQRRKQPRN